MTMTLLVLASIAAANPLRAAAASPAQDRGAIAAVTAAVVGALVLVCAIVSGPLLDAIDVSGPSAGIAAGVALLAVCAKDLFARPPAAEPALAGRRAGIIPIALPVVFSPALALVAMAGADDRGVVLALAAAVPAVALAAAAIARPPRRGLRGWLASVATAGVGVAVLMVLDGVYSI